jgi:sulfur carrier protein
MQIIVNDVMKDVAEAMTLHMFLQLESLAGRRIAVERNGEIVPKSAYADTQLQEGDRLEIVHAIGGG